MDATNTVQESTITDIESLWVIMETHTESQNEENGRYVCHEFWHGIADQECLDQFCEEYEIEPMVFDELTEKQLVDALLPKVATGEFGRFYIKRNTYFDFNGLYKNGEDLRLFMLYREGVECDHGAVPELPDFL